MNEKNTLKEYLQYNEKEKNVKNIVFYPCQVFNPCQNFVESHHPRNSCQDFMDPRHPL